MNPTDLPTVLRNLAGDFAEALQRRDAAALPPPSLPAHQEALHWQNRLFAAPTFRRAHVELFEIPEQFAVVHVCVVPQLGDPAPIFGFDMLAGRAQATGIFLDFSPVTRNAPEPALSEVVSPAFRAGFAEPRAAPPWGHVFSPDFFAIRPASEREITQALALARRALSHYLSRLTGNAAADPAIIEGQSAYCMAQRQNPHTVRMLARYVGQTAARAFVDDILFPLPAELTFA